MNLVVGLGVTGWSVVRFLRARGERCAVVDTRENPPHLLKLRQQYPEVDYFHLPSDRLDALALFKPLMNLTPAVRQVIVSPGVNLQQTLWRQTFPRAKVIGDIELFMRSAECPVVAITGSNGKSTVTTLVGALLQGMGYRAPIGGNLGTPALDLLPNQTTQACQPNDYYVLELSSYQLELIEQLDASVAVLLNMSEDHMDHYATFAEYLAAKQKIFHGCACAVLNRDPEQAGFYQGVEKMPSCQIFFGAGQASAANAQDGHNGQTQTKSALIIDGNTLYYDGKPLLSAQDLKLCGQHNLYNVAASFGVLLGLNLPINKLAIEAACAFPGLEHRAEFVTRHRNVVWYNDSKGTNVGATLTGMAGLAATLERYGKIVLTLGGMGKNADFSGMRAAVRAYARAVIYFGRDAQKIKQDLAISETDLPQYLASDLAEVVQQAECLAQPGDAIFFSPACASYDMFANFEQRGQQFKELVRKLVG